MPWADCYPHHLIKLVDRASNEELCDCAELKLPTPEDSDDPLAPILIKAVSRPFVVFKEANGEQPWTWCSADVVKNADLNWRRGIFTLEGLDEMIYLVSEKKLNDERASFVLHHRPGPEAEIGEDDPPLDVQLRELEDKTFMQLQLKDVTLLWYYCFYLLLNELDMRGCFKVFGKSTFARGLGKDLNDQMGCTRYTTDYSSKQYRLLALIVRLLGSPKYHTKTVRLPVGLIADRLGSLVSSRDFFVG